MDPIDRPLLPDETEVVGGWVVLDGEMRADGACERIQALTSNALHRLKVDPASGGWRVLFRDPADGRLWELDHPESNLHGGGPPRLTLLPRAVAEARYGCTR